ncbi:MAG: hypothetical protein HZB38_03890 [Planctomycetes bacterium]|nr:hypothetical protein [Planctomycetota bacterium]
MHGTAATTLILMLFPPLVQADNPWIERAPAALQRAKDAPSVDSYLTALDVLRRADQRRAVRRRGDDREIALA